MIKSKTPKIIAFDRILFNKIFVSTRKISLQNLPIRITPSPANVAFVDRFIDAIGGGYMVIIGIHAFRGKNCFNFAPSDWIALGMEIARESSDILVIFTNRKSSGYEFAPFESTNIAVFVNDDDLLNLAEIMKRFDCFCAQIRAMHTWRITWECAF